MKQILPHFCYSEVSLSSDLSMGFLAGGRQQYLAGRRDESETAGIFAFEKDGRRIGDVFPLGWRDPATSVAERAKGISR